MSQDKPAKLAEDDDVLFVTDDAVYRYLAWRCPEPGERYLTHNGKVAFETGRFETMFNDNKRDLHSCRIILKEMN